MALKASGFLTFQTLLAGFKARLGLSGAARLLANGGDLGLLLAEVLHQRNVARADPRAGAALNAVGKIVCRGLVVLLAFTEPVKLLRQQIRRAGVGAGAAADAALLLLLFAHLAQGRSQQAVGYLDHRYVEPRQGEAHQRTAHDHHLFGAGVKAGVVQQVAHRRPETRPDVTGLRHGFAGQGDHALGQRLAVDNRALHRVGGADVLHQYADIRRASAVGNLLAGQYLRQLLSAAGGVFCRYHPQADASNVRQHGAHHRDSLRLVVLNADQHLIGLQNMGENAHAVDNLRGAVLHQPIIGGDVGFALGGVDDKRADLVAAAAQLSAGGEACAAQPGDAELVNALNQRLGAALLPVAPAVARKPAVFAVGLKNNAHLRQAGRMRGRVWRNGGYGAGGRGVNGQHSSPAAGQRLTAQHAVAGGDAKFALAADVLFKRHDVALRQRNLAQRRTV